MSTAPLAKVPEWLGFVADVISYVAMAWLFAQAASWLGKDNWIVALGMGIAAAWLLNAIAPQFRQFLKGIVMAIFEAVVELIEFFATWLREAAERGFASILQAIIRILVLAAFMWIWNLAQSIPAIKSLIDLIVDSVGKAIAWVNQLFDSALSFINDLRLQVRTWIDNVLAGLGDIGRAIRDDVMGIVDRLFAGLRAEMQELRFDLLNRLDLVRNVLRLEIEVLGVKIRLIPDEVRTYLLARYFAATAVHYAQVDQGIGDGAQPPVQAVAQSAAPWAVADSAIAEVLLAEAGLAPVEGGQFEDIERELRQALAKIPALARGPFERMLEDMLKPWRALPPSAMRYVLDAEADLRAVLAGRPPVLPDWPPEFRVPPPGLPA